MDRLLGRRAVVTGGARGIGAAMARAFVAEGADVVILDLDGERPPRRLRASAPPAGHAASMSDPAQVDAAFDDLDRRGSPSTSWSTMLRSSAKRAVDQTVDDFHVVVDTNLLGTFLCSRAALRGMRRRGAGVIINMSSVLG